MRLPRTTGLLSGLLIVVLGAWAGLIPFIGPYFDYGFTPDEAWHYSSSRLWLDILPAAAAVVGGLMMMLASRRPSGALGGWLAMAGGTWLIIGPSMSLLWQDNAGIGDPLGGSHRQAIEWIGYFYGVGALILGLAGFATGRFVSRPHVAEREVEHPARGATPAAAEPDRRSQPQPTAEDSAESPAATSTTSQTSAAEGQPVAPEPTAAPPARSAGGGEGERASQTRPVQSTRVRRRRGGLVDRLLGRHRGS